MKLFLSRAQKRLAGFRGDQPQGHLLYDDAEKVPNRNSPIESLPAELLLSIFQNCSSQIRERIRLTHTCRHWRQVVLHTASLWTHLVVDIGHRGLPEHIDKSLSLLRMQLDRAGKLPLEVYWCIHPTRSINSKMMKFLREGAPFSQWQVLSLCMVRNSAFEDITFDPSDSFGNLESLVLGSVPSNSFIEIFSRTATSKLKSFNLRPLFIPGGFDVTHLFRGVLRHLSHLVLPVDFNRDADLPLPGNLVHLQAGTRRTHAFPHVVDYELSICIFEPAFAIDLANVTTLIVNSSLEVHPGCHVMLPSLRNIKFRRIWLGISARIEAPILETVHLFAYSLATTDDTLLNGVTNALHQAGYLLSPKRWLKVDLYLPADRIIQLLDKAPCATAVSLCFSSEAAAQLTIDYIFNRSFSITTPIRNICPQLRELKMTFRFVATESIYDEWRTRATTAVEGMRKSSPDLVPSIYGSWKGEGSFRRLA